MSTLGRLERVELRSIWEREDTGFTKWLAKPENLSVLSETLGIELEARAVEENVGPFRADLLCSDSNSDEWVLIENQMERTDHSHLGQLLTYAAGLETVSIVWIAKQFTEEHRAALDWLNDITDERFRFFGLEIEVWRIADSLPAPKFEIVSMPNDWSRQTTKAKKTLSGELSPRQQLQLSYWTKVEERVANSQCPMTRVKASAQSWVWHSIGRTGLGLSLAMNVRENWIRAELYLRGQEAKSNFKQLEANRVEIDAKLPEKADWQELPDKIDCRICIALGADPTDESDWQRQHEWLVDTASEMHRVFSPYVMRLQRRSSES